MEKNTKKMVLGSYLVITLILLVGLSSLYSMIKFNENSQTKAEINELVGDLNHIIGDLFLLINTDNLDDYNELREDIEFDDRVEINLLHKKVEPVLEEFGLAESFDNDFNKFTEISDALIIIQRSVITDNNEFEVEKGIEKSLRHGTRSAVSNNLKLLSDNWRMGYYSKETLYQYRDEKHLNEWLESIEEFKNNVRNSNLQQGVKSELLEQSDLYNAVARQMGGLVLRQVSTEGEKRLKIQELEELVEKIEDDGKEVSKEVKSKGDSLARNTFLTIITITLIGVIFLLLIPKIFFLRPISKNIKIKK